MKKKFYLIIAILVAVVLSGGTYAYTYTTAGVTIGATADPKDIATVYAGATPPSGWTAPSGYGVPPSWSPVINTAGSITKGSIFWIDPGNYTGDLLVTVYLTNSAALTSYYTYVNMAMMVHSSPDGTTWSEVTNPPFKTAGKYNYYLALTNGYAQFKLPGGNKYHIAIDNGVWYCINTSGIVDPSYYCEVGQA